MARLLWDLVARLRIVSASVGETAGERCRRLALCVRLDREPKAAIFRNII